MAEENRFKGLSTLRKEEKKGVTAEQLKLQEYLKKYTDGATGDDQRKGKKKKKKKPALPTTAQPLVIDEDITGFAAAPKGFIGKGGSDEEEEDVPIVVNEEAGRVLQKQLEKAKNYYAADEDGSGWVSAQAERAAAARRQRHDSPDASPPRQRQRHDSPDASPPRQRQRHDSPGASPPRRRARHDSPDASPPRRQRHDSPDASPPRRGRPPPPDASPPRRRPRHDSPDASPPRRPSAAAADASPPRRQRHDSPDASPPMRGRPPAADASPPRRQRHDSPDASPPRRPAGGAPPGPPGTQRVMADGTSAGLVSREVAEREAQKLRAEAAARKLRAQGRGTQTVVRDKATGRMLSAEEQAAAEAEKKAKEAEDQHLEWRGGLAQKRAAEERRKAMQEAAAKPFAHHDIDDDAEVELRERERWGDPMAGKVRQKGLGDPLDLAMRYSKQALKKSGFIIPQEVPPHSWLRRKLPAPHNRYGIKPGRHWDGVDRSNGAEKRLMLIRNERAVRDREAHEWAVADM